MSAERAQGRWRRPRVPTVDALRTVASAFDPPYDVEKEDPLVPLLILGDCDGSRPQVSLRHRYDRRLFLRASYLRVGSTVAGRGPGSPVELKLRLRGPLARQRSTVVWSAGTAHGEWVEMLDEPLRRAVGKIQAIQSLVVRWSPRKSAWRIELETMSGSVVSGITSFVPVAVPFDREEAEGFIDLIDAFASTRA